MALAGSNGGSWSTTYSPKPTPMSSSEGHAPSSEHEVLVAANTQFQRELRGRLSIVSNASHGVATGDRISTLSGDCRKYYPMLESKYDEYQHIKWKKKTHT